MVVINKTPLRSAHCVRCTPLRVGLCGVIQYHQVL